MLVDDQSFVVAPANPRYDEIRDFAQTAPESRDITLAVPPLTPVEPRH